MVSKEQRIVKKLSKTFEPKSPVNNTLFLPNHSGVEKSIQDGRGDLGWDDQQINLGSVGFGASAPTWTAYKGGEILAFNKAQNNKIFFNAQLPHGYKLDSNIEFHFHIVHPDTGTGNSVWKFTYSWASMFETFQAETTVNKTIEAPGQADLHEYAEIIEEIDGTGKGISSILICSLERTGTDEADTYDDDCYLVGADFHFKRNSIGSRQETVK